MLSTSIHNSKNPIALNPNYLLPAPETSATMRLCACVENQFCDIAFDGVVRFMKGVARTRPALPRYHCIWDVNVVLDVCRMQPLVEFLSLYDLTLRTVTLLALVSAQRCQTLHMLDLDYNGSVG